MESISFGNGVRFDGSLVPLLVFREKLIELRKRDLINEGVAAGVSQELLKLVMVSLSKKVRESYRVSKRVVA